MISGRRIQIISYRDAGSRSSFVFESEVLPWGTCDSLIYIFFGKLWSLIHLYFFHVTRWFVVIPFPFFFLAETPLPHSFHIFLNLFVHSFIYWFIFNQRLWFLLFTCVLDNGAASLDSFTNVCISFYTKAMVLFTHAFSHSFICSLFFFPCLSSCDSFIFLGIAGFYPLYVILKWRRFS